jgi:hypothetical protein
LRNQRQLRRINSGGPAANLLASAEQHTTRGRGDLQLPRALATTKEEPELVIRKSVAANRRHGASSLAALKAAAGQIVDLVAAQTRTKARILIQSCTVRHQVELRRWTNVGTEAGTEVEELGRSEEEEVGTGELAGSRGSGARARTTGRLQPAGRGGTGGPSLRTPPVGRERKRRRRPRGWPADSRTGSNCRCFRPATY